MKKFTLRNIYESKEAWQKLCALPKPVTMAWETGRYFSRVLLPEIQEIEKQRQALFVELGKPTPDGMQLEIVAGPNAVEYQARLAELLAKEIELPLVPITFAALMEKLGSVETSDDALILTEPFFGEAPKPTAG